MAQLFRRAAPKAALASFFIFASCAARAPEGLVRIAAEKEDPRVEAAAAKLEGLLLESSSATNPFGKLAAGRWEGTVPDLIEADADAAFYAARDAGSLLPPALRPRGVRPLRAFAKTSASAFPAIPVEAAWYALWYDADLLIKEGLEPPATFEELKAIAVRMSGRSRGVVALGASYGWPLALWYAYADLRLNGGRAYRERIEGKRRFDDPDSAAAMAEVFALFRSGAMAAGSGSKSWAEAWADLAEGRAAFCLMGSFAVERIPPGRDIRAVPVPAPRRAAGVDRGELALVSVLAVPAGAGNPAAAAALAAASAAVPGPGDRVRTDVRIRTDAHVRPSAKSDDPGAAILDAADSAAPPLDKALPPQFAYDAMRFFAELAGELERDPSAVDAAEACRRLEGLRAIRP